MFIVGLGFRDGSATANKGMPVRIMKTKIQLSQTELNEIFRQAGEAAVTEAQDMELAMIVQAINAAPDLARKAIETVGIAGFQRHLETKGFKPSLDRLRRALIATRMWRSKHHKAKSDTAA